MRVTGRYERSHSGGEQVAAFVPLPLPPVRPPLRVEGARAERLRLAERALVRLGVACELVPSLDWFIYSFVRKEAVLSSQIEGTQATLVDLLAFEASPDVLPGDAVAQVCNYLDALAHARAQLGDPRGLPLSIRLLCEAHARLMAGVRGHEKLPGKVRRTQNWIGGTRPGNAHYVPPPPALVGQLLGDLEVFLHATGQQLHPLIRAGLAHAQFETIHPFLDGNGRIGRLLVTLLLEHWGLLREPVLYLSLYFKQHRDVYYRRLDAVRAEGDWEGWIDFFLDGVLAVAEEAATAAQMLFALVAEDRRRVLLAPGSSVVPTRLFEMLPRHPLVCVASAVSLLQITKPTAGRAIHTLAAAGILVETTGRQRDRWYCYQGYLERLRAGTDLEVQQRAAT